MTTDEDIVARLSALTEEQALAYFWIMVSKRAHRIDLLAQLGKVTIQRAPSWSNDAVRIEHECWVRPYAEHADRRCFSCAAARPLFWHHVIEIQHGGSNHFRNQVSICFSCHKRLHPWLEEPPDQRPARKPGFESVGEILTRLGFSRFAKKARVS